MNPSASFGRLVACAAIVATAALAACGGGSSASAAAPAPPPVLAPAPPPAVPPPSTTDRDAVLADLQERSFRYFWDTANPANGLIPDRYPSPSVSSVAAVGFGLTAYPIGVERGYISREAARGRVLATLRFFRNARQGPEAAGNTGYKGFFYHWLNMKSGARDLKSEISTVDTALFLAGALFCQSYFDGTQVDETEIRRLADEIYRQVDWLWAQSHLQLGSASASPAISNGWYPESGFIPYDWVGYNEGMIVYLLALGSPTFPVAPNAWATWTKDYNANWQAVYGQQHLNFPPLFGHQYSHVWVDFRNIQDAYMRGKGIDYFENSRRAAYAQQAYAIANPQNWKDYSANIWGLTASDGPTDSQLAYAGQSRRFYGYIARGLGGYGSPDDGTIAPTAAASSIPFAPEIAIPAVLAMREKYGANLYSTYGFFDAFNPSFEYSVTVKANSRVVPGAGWFDNDYIGIDQGPIVAMLENYRSELVWKTMRKNSYLRNGLIRAGFTGGWLALP